ncbi:nucleotide-binding alpha-beta plait domain-containing protein [Tanacetum coccineum]
MGSKRSVADEVMKISTSVFVTNFPVQVGAKELWHACKQYGQVVDAFIPNRKSKLGKRFGFVRFIKVFDAERLANNLCTVWIGSHRLHANIARFQRPTGQNTSKYSGNSVDKRKNTAKVSINHGGPPTLGNSSKGLKNLKCSAIKTFWRFVNNNSAGSSTSSTFLDDQISKLISLIKENSMNNNGNGVHANMAVNVIDISYLNIKVSHSNRTEALITKVGNLVLTKFLTLYDVLVVPEYSVTLVSVHKIAKDTKFIVGFDESKCFLISQDLMDVKLMGIVYSLDMLRTAVLIVSLYMSRKIQIYKRI